MPDVARRLPMFPLGTVLLPGGLLPLHVFEERYQALVADCLRGEPCFGVVLIERGSEVGGGDQRVDMGTVARIEATRPFDDGRWALLARGTERIAVVEWLDDAPYPVALVADRPDDGEAVEAEALARAEAAVYRACTLASELGQGPGPDVPDDGTDAADDHDALEHRAEAVLWRPCDRAPLTAFDRQRLLGAPGSGARAALLIELAQALGDDLGALL